MQDRIDLATTGPAMFEALQEIIRLGRQELGPLIDKVSLDNNPYTTLQDIVHRAEAAILQTKKGTSKRDQLITHQNNLAALFTRLGGKTADGRVLTGRQLSLELLALDRENSEGHRADTERIKRDILRLLPGLNGLLVIHGEPIRVTGTSMALDKYPLTKDDRGYGLLSPKFDEPQTVYVND